MNSDLLESIDTALPNLEEIRERIIATEATKANRTALDRAYVAVVDALDTLERLRNGDYQPTESATPEKAAAVGSSDASRRGSRSTRLKNRPTVSVQ